MKPKEKELLSLLFQSQNQYLTSRQLAARLNLSERTVRTYIHRLEPIVMENGGLLDAKQGSGYRLVLNRPTQFEVLVSQTKLEAMQSEKDVIETSGGRRDVLLSRLLLNNEVVEGDELADQLCISVSTLKKELASLKQLLEAYDLRLCSSKRQISIEGDEKNKRALILNYFFKNAKFSSLREYMDHSGFFDDIPSETLLMIILDEVRKEHVQLSDMMVQNILMHLALSIKRLESGQKLQKFDGLEVDMNSSLFRTARRIVNRLSSEIGIDFPQEEISYLTLHLGVKGNDASAEGMRRKELLEEELHTALVEMQRRTGTDYPGDELLNHCLLDHLVPMLVRIAQGIQQQNPLTDEMKRDHLETFNLVREVFSRMPSLRPYHISDDEWAYLAIHILAAAERQQEQAKLQVLVICATGMGSSQLLKSRLMKYFSNSIHIVSEAGYYDMNETILQGIDLIISSVNMGPVIFGVPFLHVSVFLSDSDVEKIQTFIDKASNRIKKVPVLPEPPEQEHLKAFERLFSKSRYFVFEGHPTRTQVLKKLSASLAETDKENFQQHLLDQIALRESMGSVAFSDTVAVPHPAVPLARECKFAVGVIPEGMAWDSSHPLIRLVFLMSPSYKENDGLKLAVSGIINLIDLAEMQSEILEQPDFESFTKLFTQIMK